jgi:hypothetical protein
MELATLVVVSDMEYDFDLTFRFGFSWSAWLLSSVMVSGG